MTLYRLLLSAILLGIAMPAVAQQTREEAIATEQAEKAKALHPYEPTKAEKRVEAIERALLGTPDGFYPAFGGIYGGGGLAVGAGYRRFYGDRTFWDLKGLFSIKAYKLVELSTTSPGHAGGRLEWNAHAGWRDATQVAFHGTGIDSPKNGRTNFRLTEGFLSGGLRAHPHEWTVVGAEVSYEDYAIDSGRGRAPSIEEVHTPASAPGLGVDPVYVHTAASAGIDWRPSPGYARRGGLYEVTYHSYADREDTYSFDRVDAEVVQHLPILRENWVLSFHGLVQTTLNDEDTVPFFLLPSLGSGDTLRAYSSWRFRDRHSLLLSGEWRWIPNRLALDMALFFDAGKVVSRRGDLGLDDLKRDVGIGVRFHGPSTTPLRIEFAKGSEGPRLVITGGAAF